MHRSPRCCIVLVAALLLGSACAATAGAVAWSPDATWPGRWLTLGPTGARGWVHQHRIHIIDVAPGSPAEGLLKRHDTIVGAAGARFGEGTDPRVWLGDAIDRAQSDEGRGRLALLFERDGKGLTIVVIQLPVLGSYSATWPFECAKSARILDEACAYLARMQYPHGGVQSEFDMATMWSGLPWLASGDPRYLDNARRAAYRLTAQSYSITGLNCWPCGYGGLFMAEYYLATGDRNVLPWLEKHAGVMAVGQMKCGSWGHSAPWGGYGAVNQIGLVCYAALLLTKECGIPVNEAVLERSATFFKSYAGKGWVPYGDHVPWRGPSGNGKNALAAVAFQLLGTEPDAVRAFSRSVARSHPYREDGHTGSFFSFFWGPPAAIHAGEGEFRTFLDAQRWYYALCRGHDGGVWCQPNPENLSGRTPGSYTWSGPEFSTGGMALVYALPLKRLRILGAERSVFGRKLPKPLAQARALYEQRKWAELDAALEKLPADQKSLGQQLATAAKLQRESVTHTLSRFGDSIAAGDAYRASELLKSLERLLGKDDPRLAAAQKTMSENERWVEEGRKYYEAWWTLRDYTWQSWHYYGQQAKAVLDHAAPVPPGHWTPILAASEKAPQTWKMLALDGGAAPPKGWQEPGFDDSKWASGPAPVVSRGKKGLVWTTPAVLLRKTFDAADAAATLRLKLKSVKGQVVQVYLNGMLVATAVGTARRGYASIPLDPAAGKLLKQGRNCIAVHGLSEVGKGQSLDIGLDGQPRR